jgi:hypothetical protein
MKFPAQLLAVAFVLLVLVGPALAKDNQPQRPHGGQAVEMDANDPLAKTNHQEHR